MCDSWPGSSDSNDDSYRGGPVPLTEPLAMRLAAQDIEVVGESLMHNRTFTVFPAVLGKAKGKKQNVVVKAYAETNMPRLADVPLTGRGWRASQRRGAGSVEDVAEYAREMNILAGSEIRHPHLLRVLAFSKLPRDWVCTEAYEMTLFDYIHARSREHAGNWRACALLFHVLADIAEGLAYLHHKNFVHKDVNSKHVLFKADFRNVVLSGYSLSKQHDSSGLLSSAKRGEIHWMDPLCFEHPYAFHNDIYSLGVVLGEILTGRAPFNLDPHGSVVKRLVAGAPTHVIDEDTQTRWPRLTNVYHDTTCGGVPVRERLTAARFRADVLSAVGHDDALEPRETRAEERAAHNTTRGGGYDCVVC
jgi:serine/threonine protein kinase